MKSGVFFVKKVENGVFCKKWTFPRRRVAYVQYQYFFILHFTYFFFGGGGCVRTQRTPLPTGLGLGPAVDAVRFTITRRQRRQLGLHAAMEWSGWLVAADKTGKLIGSAINKTCQLDPSPV